jgi:polyhydroxybutyrate depolymerase
MTSGCGSTSASSIDPDAAGTPDSGACPNSLAPGDYTETLDHDGVLREYLVHVPAGYSGTTPVPLVIDIHGFRSPATQEARISGWREKSDAVGFIVVAPKGLDLSWNAGSLCCGTSLANGVDDEGFLRALVAQMGQEACIDAKRVYATGLSNGGAMAHMLACQDADLFAATAPVSMGNLTIPCQPARPISVVMFRGTTDLNVPYDGGEVPGALADFNQWKSINGCAGEPSTTHGICQTYSGCSAGVEVTLCTINAGHVLYADAVTQGAAIPDVAWEAFARQTLP